MLREHREFGDCRVGILRSQGRWKQNGYTVLHKPSGSLVLIDPGEDAAGIVREVGESGGELKTILLTHPHHDHMGAAAEVCGHFGIAAQLHNKDLRLLRHAPMYALRFANEVIPALTSYTAFEDFESGAEPLLTALHTPGHTPGSVCYLFEGFVFTGDLLLYRHVGRTDLPGGNQAQIADSIDRLLSRLPAESVIFPGHGRAWQAQEAAEWWRDAKLSPPAHDSFQARL